MSSTIEFEKICEHCGASFIARKSSTRYCSKRCAEYAYKQRKREEHVASTPKAINDSSSMIESPQRDYLSPTECANLLGLCRRTVYYYLSNNIIPCFQFKGRTRIRRADIETLFDNATDYVKRERKRSQNLLPNSIPQKRCWKNLASVTVGYISGGQAQHPEDSLPRKDALEQETHRSYLQQTGRGRSQ